MRTRIVLASAAAGVIAAAAGVVYVSDSGSSGSGLSICLAPQWKACTSDQSKINEIIFKTGDGYKTIEMQRGQPLPSGAPYPGTPNPHTFGGFQRWSAQGATAWDAMLGGQLVNIAASVPDKAPDGSRVITCMVVSYLINPNGVAPVWLNYTAGTGWAAGNCQ